MKQFEIPEYFRSGIIARIKDARKLTDPRKKDFTPAVLDFGPVQFLIPRHFGFCYGVENAIEISYKALEENPGKRIFLLSQMIHNPEVNADLESLGIRFIMDTEGKQFIPWDAITPDDVIIIPAFGTTVEIERILSEKGIKTEAYNTTCPFVEKVWKRSEKLGLEEYSVIIHGKHRHEETRATFSRSYQNAPSLVVKDMAEAVEVSRYMKGQKPEHEFYTQFAGRYSEGFDAQKHLQRIGVVNQTTMLATETQAIADFFRKVMEEIYGIENIKKHFADTRDTLCYATNDNQQATYGVLEHHADLALVVGGYNSSNTSHIVSLCKEKMPAYFIKNESEIIDGQLLHHFNYPERRMETAQDWLPQKEIVRMVLTSGASCPDAVVERVLRKVLSLFPGALAPEDVVETSLLSYR